MSITHIKENIDNLDKKSKEELISYINELLLQIKRKESKIISLQSEIKYQSRTMNKAADILKNASENKNSNDTWKLS